MKRLISFLLLTSLGFAVCSPTKNFFHERERGWFWKEVCKEETQEEHKEEKKEEPLKLGTEVKIPWDKIETMHPDEIRKIQKEAQAIAIMHPTYENVKEYKKLMMWISEKSREYAKMDYLVSKTESQISSYLAERPSAPWARRAYFKTKFKNMEEIIAKYKDKAGLVIFETATCPYCKRQKPIIKRFTEKYGWEVKWVEITERPVAARRLQVNTVPDIFLVLNREGKAVWQRIATGLQTLSSLEKQIIWGLYNLKEVSDEDLL